jgi:hypothetical protein
MTKIYYGRDLIGRFTCDGKKYTRFQLLVLKIKRALKRVIIVSAVICLVLWGIVAGATYFPRVDIVEAQVIKEVKGKTPVMDRIAKCESGNSHIDPKTGQVYMVANTNKTVDVGKYMINSVWHKKAKELGFDITKEVDNEKMAYWIYENMGTEAWVYSKHCWNK